MVWRESSPPLNISVFSRLNASVQQHQQMWVNWWPATPVRICDRIWFSMAWVCALPLWMSLLVHNLTVVKQTLLRVRFQGPAIFVQWFDVASFLKLSAEIQTADDSGNQIRVHHAREILKLRIFKISYLEWRLQMGKRKTFGLTTILDLLAKCHLPKQTRNK